MPQTVLVVDDDPIVGEGVAMGIARAGRRVIVCRDIACAHLVLENHDVDAIVADIQFRGEFSFDGLDLVGTLKNDRPEIPIFLMTGAAHDGLEREALRRGAAGFFRKPFSVGDLDDSLPAPSDESTGEQQINVPELEQLIEQDLIRMRFQPIVELPSRHHVGLEALARPTTESMFASPELLFRYAATTERTIDLEQHCIAEAIRTAANLHPKKILFLNVHPSSLESPAIVRTIERAAQRVEMDLSRITLEITEQGALHSRKSLDQIRALKGLGLQFALDDIGTAFSHLPYIDEIDPAWMKISQFFGTGFESDNTKSRIVKSIASLASSFNARFILEGIETEETAKAAEDLGIGYGQGYLFARPSEIETFHYV